MKQESMQRFATRLGVRSGAVLAAALLAATSAMAVPGDTASGNSVVRLKVLNSESHSVVVDDSGVPKNCDGVNFDAYCNSTRTAMTTHVLLVQAGASAPFRITCNVDSRFSRCADLPMGETFDARMEKRGVTVYFQDEGGKARRQLYAILGSSGGASSRSALAGPVAAGTITSRGEITATPAESSKPVAGQPSTVKCRFASTPSGAEVEVDGKFAGSTPSSISLTTGMHSVSMSMPGYAGWKRNLEVLPDSELTVNGILQQTQ